MLREMLDTLLVIFQCLTGTPYSFAFSTKLYAKCCEKACDVSTVTRSQTLETTHIHNISVIFTFLRISQIYI